MKSIKIIFCITICLTALFSCKNTPVTNTISMEITNPILPGFYPDPSICKGADGYYMVTSTFGYFPGIPVFYSPDMVHWEQVGNVLNRIDQLQVDSLGITDKGTYAPTIEYHNGTYYVACTEVGNRENYIVTAKDPRGPWSALNVFPEVIGFDPSLFFDEDGRTYIIYNSEAPDNKPLYTGHHTIRINEIDINKMAVISDNAILVNGGVDLSKKPIWIEGPHMYKVNEYYYVFAAEGGTCEDHSQVIFRSKNVMGPFEPWDQNPILTQKGLDPNRIDPVTSTGHADMIQDLNGNWWAIFLGCRPYTGDHYNLGRETFMAPVKWQDGWPIINPDFEPVQNSYVFSGAFPTSEDYTPLNGAFSISENFKADSLDFTWLTIRASNNNWYNIDTTAEGSLNMDVLPYKLIYTNTPSFIGRRQQHKKGFASTQLYFNPETEADKAGLVVFQNIGHYYFLCQTIKEGKPVVQLLKAEGDSFVEISSETIANTDHIQLKIESDVDVYRFFYAEKENNWNEIGPELDAKFLSTNTAGGFTGCLYAMYAFTDNENKDLKVKYHWFKYSGK
ncbi:glycoside hydrolase family 43 protein [Plebeiibacterium sediminum]|uniref:Glycoside hydrolase family 43 protein n=1 Tax=Plebeiibacterium sediminum TaxID=2992112 RepID=A0AAE3M3V3_9BACT|nr:glycoside hydrolase family 43 protein [Plebeiobacterium sediminum]MCW3786712.1 glycoside hydrolase family 43 protein [Plebeiobacterium sediminum]